jgi:Spy/CpxP family protein refolding chaperone
MKLRFKLAALTFCLVSLSAQAQHGNGGPPPGQHGGGPAGPGNSGGPGNTGGGPSNSGGPRSKPSTSNSPAVNSSGNGAQTSGSILHFGPPGRWWDNPSVTSSIGLRSQQQQKMDSIFDRHHTAIENSYKTFLAQQARLDKLSKQSNVDSAALFPTIDAVNQARAELQKATSEMLLEIRSQMDPAQITRLEQLH